MRKKKFFLVLIGGAFICLSFFSAASLCLVRFIIAYVPKFAYGYLIIEMKKNIFFMCVNCAGKQVQNSVACMR